MEEADREAVGHLGWNAWRHNGPPDRIMANPKVAQRVREGFLRFPFEVTGPVFLAERHGVLAGWVARGEKPDCLSDVWLLPDPQSHAIGASLLEHVCGVLRAEGAGQALISTHQNHFPAIGLYRRAGFDMVWQGMAVDYVLKLEIPAVRLRRRLD
ncbi:GNAT family N-acetyltransferase [Allorhizobium undicola]|uniref:GNAT family N-acetyltransferase n=1 Tax=Allorhizobium undicola TaxID=78527 RepID=UPI000488B2FA|nr:GNAT family N-acetyltransferase [Allorhizobium undicola]